MSSKASTSTAQNGKENTKTSMRKSQRTKRVKVNDTAGRIEPQKKSIVTGKRRKTGRLSQLVNMPMDVLMEIFGHLHPLDLLHVARTTKAFRRVLMHRSSLFVWKAALSTIAGLPDCPPELSEPEWANLVFDTHCTFCSRSNIRTVDWLLRVRLCTVCTKLHVADWFKFNEDEDNCKDMTTAVPHRYGKLGYPEFVGDEYEKVHAQYHTIEDPGARKTWFMERQQLVKRIEEHAELCAVWASAQALARSDELDRLRSSRHQAIVDRLVALGWGDEIEQIHEYDDLTTHKLVKVPQLLTDRIWANISKPMIQYMEEMKANRLARESQELRTRCHLDAIKLLRRYKTECAPFTDVMPEPLDFFAFEPIKEILEQPPDINVDSESFSHLMPALDGMVGEWRRAILKKFIQEVKVGVVERSHVLDDQPLDLDAPDSSIMQRIQLACTVFACVPCGGDGPEGLFTWLDFITDVLSSTNLLITSRTPQTRSLWFPRVLGHRCLTKPGGQAIADPAMRLHDLGCYRQRWSCDSMIKVDQEACEAAVEIIGACGMDPSMATVDQMDQLDARLECLACLDPDADDPRHVVFGWRSAVKHQREHHPADPGDWRLLTASEAEVARVEEENITTTAMVPSDRKVWLCLRCLDSPAEHSWMTLEDVRGHVEVVHGVEDPQVDRDYVKDFAAPELYATFVLSEATMVKFPRGEPDCQSGDTSPSDFLVAGMALQDDQKALLVDAQKKSLATIVKATDIQKRCTALLRHITKFLEDQDVIMPGLRAYLKSQNLANSAENDSLATPESLPIYLPSSIPTNHRSTVCIPSLHEIEARLHYAQGVKTLSALRRHLRTRIESRIQATVTRYNAARAALLALQGPGDWESVLAMLKPEDVCGICECVMTAEEREEERCTKQMAGVADHSSLQSLSHAPVVAFDPRLALGEGRRTMSWIWYTVSEKELRGSSQEVEASLWVEWLKTRARAERWREELQLLDEEMCRVLQFCWWKVQWWTQRADVAAQHSDHISEGTRAYALEQSNIEKRRAIQWAAKWSAVCERAREVLMALPGSIDMTDSFPWLVVEIAADDEKEEMGETAGDEDK